MTGVPQDRMAALRQRFLQRLSQDYLRLTGLDADALDADVVKDIVHKIAGIAGTLGFPELSALALAVERAAVANPVEHPAMLAPYGALLDAIEGILAAELSNPGG